MSIFLFMLMLVHLVDRLSRRPHRLSRQGGAGIGSLAQPAEPFARPTPSAKGSRGLRHNSDDQPLM
eukprot:8616179-Pyramimonas_sp.AAC.1